MAAPSARNRSTRAKCPARAAWASGMAPRRSRAASEAPAPMSRLAPGVRGAEQRHVQLQRVGGGGDQVKLAGALATRGRHEGRGLSGRLLGGGRRDRQKTGGEEQA